MRATVMLHPGNTPVDCMVGHAVRSADFAARRFRHRDACGYMAYAMRRAGGPSVYTLR